MSDDAFTSRYVGLSGFVKLENGSFLALVSRAGCLNGVLSTDGGRTWGEEHALVTGEGKPVRSAGSPGIIRLASGGIAIRYTRFEEQEETPGGGSTNTYGMFCSVSEDDGRTWSEEYRINLPGAKGTALYDAIVATNSGRLILPVRACFAGRRSEKDKGQAMGTVQGHRIQVSGHAHYPEIDIAFVYYSDDEGRTWKQSDNYVLGWPDDGKRGTYPTDEPTVAQTRDGRLLMFSRSTLGRIVESWSDDDGTSWSRGLPNDLCNSYSPVRLRAIPSTGDLHCVWNQVTPDEIRRGFRRARLTSAISEDGGKTWRHFTTLDVADPLDKSPRQEPGTKIEFAVARKECGEMPANYCVYRYPDIRYAGDMAYVIYRRQPFNHPGAPESLILLRAIPIEWLYDNARTDLSLPNDPEEGAGGGAGEDIEA